MYFYFLQNSFGKLTKNYYIEGDKLVIDKNIILDTIELYVFKKYDYLYITNNKYNLIYIHQFL